MVTKEEFVLWKNHPVTIDLYELIQQKQNELKDYVLFGGTLGETVAQHTARAVGRVEALQDVLEWNPVQEEEENES